MEQKPSLSGLGYTPTLQLTPTTRDREYWATRPEITSETSQKVRDAQIVFIPEEDNFRNLGPFFPEGTLDLYQSLREKNIEAEIVAEDENYNELARHFDLYVVGAFLLKELVLPVFIDLVKDYLKERLLNKEKAAIHLEVTIEKVNGSNIRVDYEGPAEEFESQLVPFLREAIQNDTPAFPPSTDETKPT